MTQKKEKKEKKILIIQKLRMPTEVEYRMYRQEIDRMSSHKVLRFFQRLFGDGF